MPPGGNLGRFFLFAIFARSVNENSAAKSVVETDGSVEKPKNGFSHRTLNLRFTVPTTPAAAGPSSNKTLLLLPVRAIDLRYLQRWAEGRRRPALRQMGVDEIFLGEKQKFLTDVTNLETGEPLCCGR